MRGSPRHAAFSAPVWPRRTRRGEPSGRSETAHRKILLMFLCSLKPCPSHLHRASIEYGERRRFARSIRHVPSGESCGASVGAFLRSCIRRRVSEEPPRRPCASFRRRLFVRRLHGEPDYVAHSAGVMGAAMIAGGLYACAVDAVTKNGVEALASRAFGPCVRSPIMLDDVSSYKKTVKNSPPMARSIRRRTSQGQRFISSPAVPTISSTRKPSRRAGTSILSSGFPPPISCSRTEAAPPLTPDIPG